MNTLLNQKNSAVLHVIALLVALFSMVCTHMAVAVSLEQDANAEVQNTLDSSAATKLYGGWLFNGGFSQASFSAVNPNYRITQGDTLLVQLWGGVDYQSETKVDPQGNIFIPKVGPIKVLGVSNAKLNKVILKAVKR